VEIKRRFEKGLTECEEWWKKWAENEVQLNAGKAVSAERKKRQAKGKALPVEMVTTATQTQPEEEVAKATLAMVEVSIQTVEMRQEERGIQTEVTVDDLGEAMKRKKNRKKGK